MKKLYFIIALLCLFQLKAQGVIYSQTQIGPSAFASSKGTNGDLISLASSFILNQTSDITKINIYGTQGMGNLSTISSGLILYIYSDSNGVPSGHPILQTGTPLATININNNSPGYSLLNVGGDNYVYSINVAAELGTLSLQANTKYWLFFVPKLNISYIDVFSQEIFRWQGSTQGTPAFMRISNLTGAAAYPTWTSYPYNGAAFSIEGSNKLGTNDVVFDSTDIKVYPNPTSNYVQIKSKENIKQISLYDINGKKINIKPAKDIVYLQGLPNGSYFMVLETETNSITKKIIKK